MLIEATQHVYPSMSWRGIGMILRFLWRHYAHSRAPMLKSQTVTPGDHRVDHYRCNCGAELIIH